MLIHVAYSSILILYLSQKYLRSITMISDINYPGLNQTSQIKGIVLHKASLTLDISSQLWSPQAILYSVYKYGGFYYSVEFDNHQNDLQNSRKYFMITVLLQHKLQIRTSQWGEMDRAWSGSGPHVKLLSASGICRPPLLEHQYYCQPACSPEFQCPELLLRFHQSCCSVSRLPTFP